MTQTIIGAVIDSDVLYLHMLRNEPEVHQIVIDVNNDSAYVPAITVDQLIDYIESGHDIDSHVDEMDTFYWDVRDSITTYRGLTITQCDGDDAIVGLKISRYNKSSYDHSSYNWSKLMSTQAHVKAVIDSVKQDFYKLFEGLLIPELANLVYEKLDMSFGEVTLHIIDSK